MFIFMCHPVNNSHSNPQRIKVSNLILLKNVDGLCIFVRVCVFGQQH